MKTQLFARPAIPIILFVLHFNYNGDTPYRVWLDLDDSLNRWKRPIFKIRKSRNSQISVRKPIFFARPALTKILFVLDFICTADTPCKVWLDWDNFLTRWKRPIFKNYLKLIIRINRKFTYEKLTFFLDKLYQKIFFFYTLGVHCILHTQSGLVWTTLWPDEISIFSKIE